MENLNQAFIDAGTLLVAGMVFVFAFLGILVIFINTVLSRLAIKFPDAEVKSSPSRSKKASNAPKGIAPNVVAAIGSAVTQYRNQQSQNIKK